MTDDAPKPPAKRQTSVYGVKLPSPPPRQDDEPIVPQDFAAARDPITGVHQQPDAELAARVRRTQHATEGVAATTLNINSRLTAVESDVKLVKVQLDGQDRELAAIKTGVTTTNRLIERFADVTASKVTLEHDVTRAQVEIGSVTRQSEIKATDQKRERGTALLKTALAVVTTLLTALAAVHWVHC